LLKRISKIVNIVFIISSLHSHAQPLESSESSDDLGKLSVRIMGFANDRGECWFALDNSENVYESEDSVFIGKILPIFNKEVILEIDSLKFGVYAIRVFHDENSNGELDSDFLGIPTEDYGYSNNVSAWFGAPSWERAKFRLAKKELTIEIYVD